MCGDETIGPAVVHLDASTADHGDGKRTVHDVTETTHENDTAFDVQLSDVYDAIVPNDA